MTTKMLVEVIRAHLTSRGVRVPDLMQDMFNAEIEALAEMLMDVFGDEERTREIPPMTLAYLCAESAAS